jgi:TetR/AcrR family transcriptional regulator
VGKAPEKLRKISAIGEGKKRSILEAAVREFEKFSYGGARMQRIADDAGVPKSNIHYYFRSKRVLYNAVLKEVVELWDQAFESLNAEDDPRQVLTEFVQKKVEFTRLYPQATRIFTSEMLHGGPHLSDQLNDQMSRWTRERAEVIASWVVTGRISPIDPFHLIFMIWSSTQHYAQAELQIKSVYQKPQLGKKDFDEQASSLTTMVMRICGLE